jgi:hypothetical protein
MILDTRIKHLKYVARYKIEKRKELILKYGDRYPKDYFKKDFEHKYWIHNDTFYRYSINKGRIVLRPL